MTKSNVAKKSPPAVKRLSVVPNTPTSFQEAAKPLTLASPPSTSQESAAVVQPSAPTLAEQLQAELDNIASERAALDARYAALVNVARMVTSASKPQVSEQDSDYMTVKQAVLAAIQNGAKTNGEVRAQLPEGMGGNNDNSRISAISKAVNQLGMAGEIRATGKGRSRKYYVV